MKLCVRERLVLLSIVPTEGNFITLKIVRKLREKLSFSEEEVKAFEFVEANGQVVWNTKNENERGELEISFGEKAIDLIIEALKKLDKEGKLTDNHFSLYEKFVEPGSQLEVVK